MSEPPAGESPARFRWYKKEPDPWRVPRSCLNSGQQSRVPCPIGGEKPAWNPALPASEGPVRYLQRDEPGSGVQKAYLRLAGRKA